MSNFTTNAVSAKPNLGIVNPGFEKVLIAQLGKPASQIDKNDNKNFKKPDEKKEVPTAKTYASSEAASEAGKRILAPGTPSGQVKPNGIGQFLNKLSFAITGWSLF